MKLFRTIFIFLICLIAGTVASAHVSFHQSSLVFPDEKGLRESNRPAGTHGEYGIKEVIPKEYKARYLKWKSELLATEYGRQLWQRYASDTQFLLMIKVADSRKFGAGTDDFEWDSAGRLVAATITLGKDLDKGLPDPVYYPVMNSLAAPSELQPVFGSLLASTKFVHELGHVSFTAEINSSLFRKQNKLMESYYKIFLNNGFNTRDPRLVSLENQLGAQPIAIWEDREYWSEVTAMRFLVERINKESFYCSVMNKIRRNVAVHAQSYRDRFEGLNITGTPRCG